MRMGLGDLRRGPVVPEPEHHGELSWEALLPSWGCGPTRATQFGSVALAGACAMAGGAMLAPARMMQSKEIGLKSFM